MSRPHLEFYEANAGVIDAIVSQAGRVGSNSTDRITIEKLGSADDATIVEGAFSLYDFMQEYEDLPFPAAQDVARHAAETKNKALKHKALTKFTGLTGVASMSHVVDLYDAGLITPEDTAVSRELLEYEKGIYQLSGMWLDEGVSTLEIGHVGLRGLDVYGTADEFEVQLADRLGIARKLTVTLFDQEVTLVSYGVEVQSDPLMYRCAELLGVGIVDIVSIISKRYDTEVELDQALAKVWMDYQGTSKEQEIGPLLDEVRDRAIAVKQSHALTTEHNSNLPTTEQLTEFADLLSSS